MTITKFEAQMATNFIQIMRDYWSSESEIDYSQGNNFIAFAERVAGKKVTIEKWTYTSVEPCYFEEIDNNFPLPRNAFVRV